MTPESLPLPPGGVVPKNPLPARLSRGQARLTLGGGGGPQVEEGDVPMIGAYAGGRDWDLCRPEETDVKEARERIARSR